MQDFSLLYLSCVSCGGNLELEIFEKKNEIEEGLLTCSKCNKQYPIISSIPILIADLPSYFSIRTKLGGYLMLKAKTRIVRSLIKESLQKIKQVQDDTTDLEKTWVSTYKKSEKSLFTARIKNVIQKLPRSRLVLEHGCSIGTISEHLAKRNGYVFGIDKSFFALLEAKKRQVKNSDFFVADSLSSPFGNKKFDIVVAFNVLELIEPTELLKILKLQTRRFLLLSDPYDYERGKSSVKIKLDEKSIRTKLAQMGFKLLFKTQKPSLIPWKLNVNSRLELHYKVDLIIAEKIKSLRQSQENVG